MLAPVELIEPHQRHLPPALLMTLPASPHARVELHEGVRHDAER